MKIKKTFVLLLVIIFCGSVFSQQRDSILATKYRPGVFGFFSGLALPNRPWIQRYDRFIVDVKYNDLVNLSNFKMFNDKWSSIGFNFQFLADIPMTDSGTVSFGIGLGYEFRKFVHNRDLLTFTGKSFDFSNTSSFDKSILRTNAFFIPVELRFRTKGREHFKFHIGSNIGYRFGSNKDYIGDTTIRTQTKKMDNFEWLYVDVHARIGMRNWAVLIAADMLPVFRKTTVKTYPISLGLSISLF